MKLETFPSCSNKGLNIGTNVAEKILTSIGTQFNDQPDASINGSEVDASDLVKGISTEM